MAATVLVKERTGSGPTNTDITSTNSRYLLADSTSASTTATPLQIPSSGTNYSYWKSIYLDATVTPAGTIDTVRWYTDGANSFGTGVTEKVGTASAYTQATGSATSGLQLTSGNYTGVSTPTNTFTYTSGSPLSVTGSITNPSTGKFTDFIVSQMELASTASPGVTSAETYTITFNET